MPLQSEATCGAITLILLESQIMNRKIKRQPLPAPVAQMITPVVKRGDPRAFIDAHGHICLEVARNSGGVHFIQLQPGLTVERERAGIFDSQWFTALGPTHTKDYTAQRLARRMLEFAKRAGAQSDARAYLAAIAATGQTLPEPPSATIAPRPLPEAMRKHQFKKTAALNPTITLNKNGGSTKLRHSSIRHSVVAWLKAQPGGAAKLTELDAHFQRPMRPVIEKLKVTNWVAGGDIKSGKE